MKPIRIILAALAFAAALPVAQAQAQTETGAKPLVLVIPFPPGGPTDAMARSIANEVKGVLGQAVIVENRPGAGGNIGAEYVAHAPADGQTLLFGTSGPLAINVSLYKKVGYDPIKSFAPIINIGYLPNVLVVNPAVPAKNVRELIEYGKSHPGTLSYASSGNGASSHLAGVMFNSMAGTDFQHIPYKGTGPALNDLLGNQVAMSFTDVLTAAQFVKAGKLRALGVTTASPSKALPGVPTVAEQGLKGYDVSVFFGIVAPAATPPDVVAKLNKAFATVLKKPDLRDKLIAQGLEMASSTEPEQLRTFMAREIPKWRDVVKASGAQLD